MRVLLSSRRLAVFLFVALVPTDAAGSSHQDAPIIRDKGLADVTDVYAFQSPSDPDTLVFVATTSPAAGVATPDRAQGTYRINFDNDGDLKEDVAIKVTIKKPSSGGQVAKLVTSGAKDFSAAGAVGGAIDLPRGRFGVFRADDPAFFDLVAFRNGDLCGGEVGEEEGVTGRTRASAARHEERGDPDGNDYRAGTDVVAIVVELPKDLVYAGKPVHIWASTKRSRAGVPYVSYVGIPDEAKDDFAKGKPRNDVEDWTPIFVELAARLGRGDSEQLAAYFLPNVLTFDPNQPAGFPNGRRLEDDVADAALAAIGLPDGDCVDANDSPFRNGFPYVAESHVTLRTCPDADGDGAPYSYFPVGCGTGEQAPDCDDRDPTVRPGAVEVCDGADNDCDGQIDEGFPDQDGDGAPFCLDCDDANPDVGPGRDEICDAVDNDCDGLIDEDERFDMDGDGVTSCGSGGPADCDDTDPTVFPGAPEHCDGVDNDCDDQTSELVDDDLDGWSECAGDCDDRDPRTFPEAAEICDQVDNDCDGTFEDEIFDQDGDGHSACDMDCDDRDPAVFHGQIEFCNGIDDDCDWKVDETADVDADGVTVCQGDCNDFDDGVAPGLPESCDGVDTDCDGIVTDDADVDGDGFSICNGDCDDANPTINPFASEACGDDIDNDCDGVADEDCNTCDPVGDFADFDDHACSASLSLCGFSTTIVETSCGIVLNPVGANGAVEFDLRIEQTDRASASDLTLLGQTGYTCDLLIGEGTAPTLLLQCNGPTSCLNEFVCTPF